MTKNQRKQIERRIRIWCIGLCMMFLMGGGILGLCLMRSTVADAAQSSSTKKKLSSISAVYSGGSVLVGHQLDLTKLTVMGLYEDGAYQRITEYKLSSYTVSAVGSNQITVTSDGVATTFLVQGMKVTFLSAYYKESAVTIGEQLAKDKLVVSAYYSDGSSEIVEDYYINTRLVSLVGYNEFLITYEGTTIKLNVTGRNVRTVKELAVMYSGPAVIVGNAPKREDFYVSAVYNDNSIEYVKNFELTPAIVQKSGSNIMVVTFGGVSAEVKVTGQERRVVSVKAEYKGFPVVIGKTVAKEDIVVTATFNDDKSEVVSNFTLSSAVVYAIGDNMIQVFCENATTYILVRGVEAEIIDYGRAAQVTLRDGEVFSRVTLAVGEKADPELVTLEGIDAGLVRKAMRRIVRTDKYMAFEVSFEDPNMDVYLPMTMKVTVPTGYSKDKLAVLYTPNRKTIMATMNGEFLKDGNYEFKIFQPGTYIIADCTEQVYVESIELDMTSLDMKTGRSYSLKPVIYPHAATNQEVTYTSSRPAIVTVSEEGLLTAVSTGGCVITIQARDGSNKQCKLLVYVRDR